MSVLLVGLTIAAAAGAFWALDYFTSSPIMRKHVNTGTDRWKQSRTQGSYDSAGAESGGLDLGVGGPDGCGDASGGDGGCE